MPLPTRTDLLSLDWSSDGQPFCLIHAKGDSLDGLDWSVEGQPFWGPGTGTSGTAYTRTFTDAIAPADAFASVSSFIRAFSDPATLGDTRTISAAFARAFADPATLGDSRSRAASFARSTSDAAALGDSLSDTAQFVRSYSDPASLGETRQSIAGFIRTVADPAALGESFSAEISTAQAYTRSFADAIAMADQALATIGISYLPLGQPHTGLGLLIEIPATDLVLAPGQTNLTMEFPA